MKFSSKERNIFVCSDPHYSHKNLIKNLSTWKSGAHRDFKSIDHHNDTLVANINKTVGQEDVLFMLGDVAFGGFENVKIFMDRIICREVHLIFGNHDEHIISNRDGVKDWFTTTSFYREIQIDKEMFVLFHYPINEWNGAHKGWYHLYGHQHNLPEDKFSNTGKSMDCGFDGHTEFRPYNIMTEIIPLLKDREIIIHH
jgi:calcineurin-like phosphoesterase family protein